MLIESEIVLARPFLNIKIALHTAGIGDGTQYANAS